MLSLLLLLACGAPDVACDTLTCTGGAVCVATRAPPVCEDLVGEGTCPEGTTETMCGGDGHPCCCGPTPAPVFACLDGCGATPSCDCVTCDEGLECQAQGTEGVFACEELPVP